MLRRAIAQLQAGRSNAGGAPAAQSRAAGARRAVALEKVLHTVVGTAEAALSVVLTAMQQALGQSSGAGPSDEARELVQRACIVQVCAPLLFSCFFCFYLLLRLRALGAPCAHQGKLRSTSGLLPVWCDHATGSFLHQVPRMVHVADTAICVHSGTCPGPASRKHTLCMGLAADFTGSSLLCSDGAVSVPRCRMAALTGSLMVQEEWEEVGEARADGQYDFSQTVDLLRACRECAALLRRLA